MSDNKNEIDQKELLRKYLAAELRPPTLVETALGVAFNLLEFVLRWVMIGYLFHIGWEIVKIQ